MDVPLDDFRIARLAVPVKGAVTVEVLSIESDSAIVVLTEAVLTRSPIALESIFALTTYWTELLTGILNTSLILLVPVPLPEPDTLVAPVKVLAHEKLLNPDGKLSVIVLDGEFDGPSLVAVIVY